MLNILIVEDEFIIANHVKELLENGQIGWGCIKDSYSDSIRYIQSELPDLVLLDIRLF